MAIRSLIAATLLLTLWGSAAAADSKPPASTLPGGSPSLAPGDVVLRYTNGLWSRLFARLNQRDPRFSHAGIVISDGDGWRVVHAEADDLGRNGRVRLDAWELFLVDSERFAVLRLGDPVSAAATAKAALAMYSTAMPFDLSFDLGRDNAVYCTELVWRALRTALNRDPLPAKARIRGREAVLVENLLLDIGELSLVHLVE